MDFEKNVIMRNCIRYIPMCGVKYNNKDYIYVVNSNDHSDTYFYEVRDNKLFNIDPILFDTIIFPMFLDKIKSSNEV